MTDEELRRAAETMRGHAEALKATYEGMPPGERRDAVEARYMVAQRLYEKDVAELRARHAIKAQPESP